MKTWIKSVRDRLFGTRHTLPIRKQPQGRRLLLDTLEDRLAPAVSYVSFASGVLTLNAASTDNYSVSVSGGYVVAGTYNSSADGVLAANVKKLVLQEGNEINLSALDKNQFHANFDDSGEGVDITSTGTTSKLTTGDTANRDFSISATNGGSSTGSFDITFSGIKSLTGGGYNDSYTFTTGALTGSVDGGGGSNSVTGHSTSTTWAMDDTNGFTNTALASGTFDNIANVTGGSGNDTFTFSGTGSLTGVLNAGGDSGDKIIGKAAGNAFNITAVNTGSIDTYLTGGFVGVANLTGAAGDDTFTFSAGGSLTGSVDGEGGTNDRVIGNSASTTWSITAANTFANTTLSTGGFSDVEKITGGDQADEFTFSGTGALSDIIGGDGSDRIIGNSGGKTFNITADDAGNITTDLTSFSSIENLTGGGGDDSFVFTAGANLTGAVDGGSATNVDKVTANEQTTFTVGAVSDAFTATNLATGGFTSVESIDMLGSSDDTVKFTDAGVLTGTVALGGGTGDHLDYADQSAGIAVDLTDNNASMIFAGADLGISGVEKATGGLGHDTFVDATSADNIFIGGEGNDSFTYKSGDDVHDGGAGDNTFIVSALPSGDTLSLENSGGDNTLNLSALSVGVTLDLNLQTPQDLESTIGDLDLDYDGTFDDRYFNVTLTDENDILSVDVDSAFTPYDLIGSDDAGDVLNIDTRGADEVTLGIGGLTSFWFADVNHTGFETVNVDLSGDIILNGTSGVDVLNVDATTDQDAVGAGPLNGYSLSLNSGATVYQGDMTAVTRLTFNADDSGDTFNLENTVNGEVFAPVNGTFYNADGGLNNGTDVYTLDDDTNTTSATYVSTSSSVGRGAGIVVFAGLEELTLTTAASAAGNGINVSGGASTTNTIHGSNAASGANDVFNVTGVGGGTTLNGAAGADAFNIAGVHTLTVNGGTEVDDLTIDDSANAAVTTYNVTGGTVIDSTASKTVTYTDIANLTFSAGGAGDTVNITGGATADNTINGGNGADQFNITADVVSLEVNGGIGNDTATTTGVRTLTYNGEAGVNTLVVNDSGNGAAADYTVNGLQVVDTTSPFNTVDYTGVSHLTLSASTDNNIITVTGGGTLSTIVNGNAGLDNITVTANGPATTINGGADQDTIKLEGVSSGTTVTADGGPQADTISVGTNANGLTAVLGTVNVNGGSEGDNLTINDDGSAAGVYSYTLTALSLTRSGSKVVNFTAIEDLTLDTPMAGTANSVSVVQTVASAGMPVTVNGKGSDTLTAPNAVNAWTIGTADDGTFLPAGGSTVTFTDVENLVGGAAADTFNVANTVTSITSSIDGGAGTDVLSLSTFGVTTGITFDVDGVNKVDLSGTVTASDVKIESLVGGSGGDVFALGTGDSLSGAINGAGGFDWLDYSGRTAGVTVNLAVNSATSIGGGITNVNHVAGGSGADALQGNGNANIFLGRGGNDRLLGVGGRDILIGGDGADVIDGGTAEDIVLGGIYLLDVFDATTRSNLKGILGAWNTADPIATKIAAIDLLPGKLDTPNVTNDSDVDRLAGGTDTGVADWFIFSTGDLLTSFQAGTDSQRSI